MSLKTVETITFITTFVIEYSLFLLTQLTGIEA